MADYSACNLSAANSNGNGQRESKSANGLLIMSRRPRCNPQANGEREIDNCFGAAVLLCSRDHNHDDANCSQNNEQHENNARNGV